MTTGRLLLYGVLAGALTGFGLLAVVLALRPARPTISATLARLDATRAPSPVSSAFIREGLTGWRASLGSALAQAMADRGIALASTRADLNVVGRSVEGFLVSSVLFGVAGLVFGPLLVALLYLVGLAAGAALPLALALLGAVFGALLPTLELRSQAGKRRRDFRHAVGAFLDLVSMNLAGGRGVPEALTMAAQIGGGWPFARIRDTLAFARLQGLTPWPRSAGSARSSTSRSCATSPRRSRWSPTTVRRSAPRCRPARPPSAAASSPRPRARRASGRNPCSSPNW